MSIWFFFFIERIKNGLTFSCLILLSSSYRINVEIKCFFCVYVYCWPWLYDMIRWGCEWPLTRFTRVTHIYSLICSLIMMMREYEKVKINLQQVKSLDSQEIKITFYRRSRTSPEKQSFFWWISSWTGTESTIYNLINEWDDDDDDDNYVEENNKNLSSC